MKKFLWLLFFYPCLVFGQANNSLDSLPTIDIIISKPILKPALEKESVTCETCNEAVELYKSAYQKEMSFSIQDLLPLVAVIKSCIKANQCSLDLSITEKVPDRDPYRGGYFRPFIAFRESSYKYIDSLDASKIVSNFKQLYQSQLSPDCKDCIKLVEKYYSDFTKGVEFNPELKTQVQRCKTQLYFTNSCKDMDKEKWRDKMRVIRGGGELLGLWKGKDNIWKLDPNDHNTSNTSNVVVQNYSEIRTYSKLGVSVFKNNNHWGVMSEEGYVFIQPKYDKIKPIKLNNDIFYIVTSEFKSGIVDVVGKEIIKPYFDEIISNEDPFRVVQDGVSSANTDNDLQNMEFLVYRKNWNLGYPLGYGFIHNKSTSIKVSRGWFSGLTYQANKSIVIDNGGRFGFVNKSFTSLLLPSYEKIIVLNGQNSYEAAFVKSNNLWGILHIATGKEVTPAKYDRISGVNVSNGDDDLYIVSTNNQFGLINIKGDVLIEPRFQSLDLLNNGVFISKLNNKAGLLNTSGQELITPKFDEILPIDNGFYPTRIGAKWGYLNEYGSEVVQPIFDSKVSFQDDIASVQSNGVSYKINKSGQRVLNNFSSSSLRELTLGDQTIYDLAASRMAEVYKDGLNKLMLESMLGSGSTNATFAQIANQKNGLQNDIRGWIGGNMTSSQQAEFNQIAQDAEANFKLSMSTLTSAFRSNASSGGGNQQSSRLSYNSYQCRNCGSLSNTTKEPLTYAFGGCSNDPSGRAHSWGMANTIHGFQCSSCGVKSYILDYEGKPKEPLTYAFGGCSNDPSGRGHYWRVF